MEFQANIPVEHFKVFSAIADLFLHFNELINVDIRNNQLILSTFNHSRTAQGLVRFSPSFFQDYKLLRHGSEEEGLTCTVANKKLSSILKKNTGNIELIKMCQITILPGVAGTDSKLTMRLIYKNGTKKTNNISYLDGDKIVALYDKKKSNHFIMNTHTIRECFIRFDPRVSEILLSCVPNHITLSTYIDPQKKIKPSNYSYTVDITDCIEYSIIEPVNVVINLKELQAIVDFSDNLEIPVNALFEEAGKPIIFTYRSSDKIILDIALMTQEIEEASQQSTGQTTHDEYSYEFVQRTQATTHYPSLHHDRTPTASPVERGISSRSTLTVSSSQYTDYAQLPASQQQQYHMLSGNEGGDEESLEQNIERQENNPSSQSVHAAAGDGGGNHEESNRYNIQQNSSTTLSQSIVSAGNEEKYNVQPKHTSLSQSISAGNVGESSDSRYSVGGEQNRAGNKEEEPLFPPSYHSSSSLSSKRKTTLQMLREKKRMTSGGSGQQADLTGSSSSENDQVRIIKAEPRSGGPAVSLRRRARRIVEESE